MQRARYIFSGRIPKSRAIHNYKVGGKRSFYAGMVDLLTNSFKGTGLSINESLRINLAKMRHRSRELVHDNDYGKKFISMVKVNVIGAKGIKLQAKLKNDDGSPDKLDNDALEDGWEDFSTMKYCTVTGKLSMLDVDRISIAAVACDGECLIRIVKRNIYKYGIALQLIEADRLDTTLNQSEKGKNRIVMSVELDEFDVPIAYYILTKHPSETVYSFNGKKYDRILAPEIIHLFLPERIAQARGIPWMHASIRRINMIGGYEEAELVAARAGASKMGFLYTETGEEYKGDDNKDGTIIEDAEPGTIRQLPKNMKFEPYDPQHPTGAFNFFMKGVLQGAAAGLGISYTGYTGDLTAVNYSSIRAGLIEERENWRVIQGWYIEHAKARIYEAFLIGALSRGLIVNESGVKLPLSRKDRFLNVRWQARGWAWVDPLKDQQANDAAVAAGHRTNSSIVAAQGEDLEEVYETLEWEKELAKAHGLEFIPTKTEVGDEKTKDNNPNT